MTAILTISLILTAAAFVALPTDSKDIKYTALSGAIVNPERGLYHQTDTTISGKYNLLDVAVLKNYRSKEQMSVILRLFGLKDFVKSSISASYKSNMVKDFKAIRDAGLKAVVRFYYNDKPNTKGGNIVPPYGDATKAQVLKHISEVASILRDNSDVIVAVQAGFIGIWGEWYYTDHFVKDPTKPGSITADDYKSRGEVISALLAALPKNRTVQIRTPMQKTKIVSGSQGYTALTKNQVFKGSSSARVGHHNDCFLASKDDQGTYDGANLAKEYAFLSAETTYLPMGGETCAKNPPRSQCPTAKDELAKFHWSYLNVDYHPHVIKEWNSGGCFNEIKEKLGYRFVLTEATLPDTAKPGASFTGSIKLRNVGYAAPFNPRPVEIWLRSTADAKQAHQVVLKSADPRFWLAGTTTHTLNVAFSVPTSVKPGNYELLLKFPDPYATLAKRPEYSIQLANKGLWEAATGLNKLQHVIKVV